MHAASFSHPRFVALALAFACARPAQAGPPRAMAPSRATLASRPSTPSRLARRGTVRTAHAPSPALGHDLTYRVYLPHGYGRSRERFATVYLLHGRGDDMTAWEHVRTDLDGLIADGRIPPVVAILPDAPASDRAGWYVDSKHAQGEAMETALTRDLVKAVDTRFRTLATRGSRVVGGYSMGGYGALRYGLAHPSQFGAAIVLSPAVYSPEPPAASSSRAHGAFGKGTARYDGATYKSLNYPRLLRSFDASQPLRMYIAVGADEYHAGGPEAVHDLDREAARLYERVRRTPGITASFRKVAGGHDWDTWRPTFVEGIEAAFGSLAPR